MLTTTKDSRLNILKMIEMVDFPTEQYYKVEHTKDQIVLHHTVSSVGVTGDLEWWRKTKERIATCIIIHHNGKPFQCFSSKYWGHHLGVKWNIFKNRGFTDYKIRNTNLNQRSIGVELDNAGGLIYRNGKWVSDFGTVIPKDRVQIYPDGFRGFFGFEKYTDAQIRTLDLLLTYWKQGKYHYIPFKYNDDIWDVNDRALAGNPGLFTHCSYRSDKSDCHPQPELIEMLECLE